MSSKIEIKVPRELRERMERFSHVDWNRELREFVEARLRTLEFLQVLDEVKERAKKRVVKTDSTTLIREDREGR
mgnify:CR=1 FL=1